MSKSKLLPRVPSVPVPGGRRAQYSSATKRALVEVATVLFTENGYSSTSLDAIVAGAEVTKGALYHHFTGKQALFEAVFEEVEAQASRHINAATRGEQDPWAKASRGLEAFLEVVQWPEYRRVVIQEGPAILGHERFREQEGRTTFANVLDIVESVLGAGEWELDAEMTETFTRIFFGAMSAAGESVARHDDPQAAGARVETAISFILAGLRSLVEQGVELPSTPGADAGSGPAGGPTSSS